MNQMVAVGLLALGGGVGMSILNDILGIDVKTFTPRWKYKVRDFAHMVYGGLVVYFLHR